MSDPQAGTGFRFGEGKIAGALSCLFGGTGLAGVLCYLFPEQLTTPQLRELYDPGLLRIVLAVVLLAAFAAGLVNFLLVRWRMLGLIGMSAATVALLLGGSTIRSDGSTGFSSLPLGLDWFALDLLGTAVVFIAIEKALPHRREQAILRPEWGLDLRYFLLIHLMVSFFAIVSTWVATRGASWAVSSTLQGWIQALPLVVQFLLAVMLADLAQYWSHRLMHTVPFFWRIHAIHHSAPHMDWLASSRLHLGEALITRVCVLLPLFLAGFSAPALYAYVLFIGFHAIWIHGNIGINFDPLRRLLVTPVYHHWHHSEDPRAANTNFAVHLPILDRLFGTQFIPKGEWPTTYGIGGERLPRGVIGQFLYPFVPAWWPKKA